MAGYIYRYICDEITKEAKETFGIPVDSSNYHKFEEHWISAAERFKEKYEKEGLPNTATYVEEVIEEVKRWQKV